MKSILVLYLLSLVILTPLYAGESQKRPSLNYVDLKQDSLLIQKRIAVIKEFTEKKAFMKLDDKSRKKITAALLTVFLGPLGVHRLYLGCSPIVPAVYVATFGGCLGILPFIDLIVIIFSDDLKPYEHNNKIFMWLKK